MTEAKVYFKPKKLSLYEWLNIIRGLPKNLDSLKNLEIENICQNS